MSDAKEAIFYPAQCTKQYTTSKKSPLTKLCAK